MELKEKLDAKIEEHNAIVDEQNEMRTKYAELEAKRQALSGSIVTLSELLSESQTPEAPKDDEPEE
jgi:predicted nuclease with TOPRIM domain